MTGDRKCLLGQGYVPCEPIFVNRSRVGQMGPIPVGVTAVLSMPRERLALTQEEVALLPVTTMFYGCAIGGCRIGCATEPSQQISPNRMAQMIFRQINGVDQLERLLNAVYLRYSYSPI